MIANAGDLADSPTYTAAPMRTSFRKGAPQETAADTLCVGLFEDEGAPSELDEALGGELGRLIDVGRGKGRLQEDGDRSTPSGAIGAARVITVGLGKRDGVRPRARARGGGGRPRPRPRRRREALAWAVPEGVDQRADRARR